MILPLLMLANECAWHATGPPTREPRVLIEAPEHARMYVVLALHEWASVCAIRFILTEKSEEASLTIRQSKPNECGLWNAGGFATDSLAAIRDWDGPATLQILIHEIGHWLGAHHEDRLPSVMYPITGAQRHVSVSEFDRNKMIERYGVPETVKWTVQERLSPNAWRYWGIGKPPEGAVGTSKEWSLLCGNCPQILF